MGPPAFFEVTFVAHISTPLYYDQNIANVVPLQSENYKKYNKLCVGLIGVAIIFDSCRSQSRILSSNQNIKILFPI